MRLRGPRRHGYLVTASSAARVRFKPGAAFLRVKDFGLQPGQDAEVLRVALEAAVLGGHFVERPLAVVTVGRMADVVGQPGQVDEVGIAAQPDRHAAADLGDLQRVGQPGARGLALARPDHLRLVGEPAQRGAVQHAGPVAGEIGAVFGVGTRQRGTLRRFDHQTLPVELVVCGSPIHCHRRTVCQYYIVEHAHRPFAQRLLAVLTVAVLMAPATAAKPPFRLPSYVTDDANALSGPEMDQVLQAVDKLYAERNTRLWVVYVDTFSGQDANGWAQNTRRASDLGDFDALLAVATVDRAYAFLVPDSATELSSSQVTDLRRNAASSPHCATATGRVPRWQR